MATTNDIVTTLFKKNQGYANTNTSAQVYQESILSEPFAKASRIATQTIPTTEPTDLSSALNLPGGGTKQTSAAYSYIVKYTNVPLTGITSNPEFAFNEPTGNLLQNAILPVGVNYRVVVTNSAATPAIINGANYVLDRDAGTLTYFPSNISSVELSRTNVPKITFWRYEGSFLSDSGLSGSTSLNSFTNQTNISKQQITKDSTWTASSSSPSDDFTCLATSIDGKYRTATASSHVTGLGYLYVSQDYGATYLQATGLTFYDTDGTTILTDYNKTARNWTYVVMSISGQYQFAFTYDNQFFLSSNNGTTWVKKSVYYNYALKAAMSYDGRNITIVNNTNVSIIYSNDYGSTWGISSSPAISCTGIAMSSDGYIQYACPSTGSNIYKSTDYGKTWVSIPTLYVSGYNFICCSKDGSKVLTGTNLYTYLSNDYYTTYYLIPTLSNSIDGCMSMDGKIIIVSKGDTSIPYISINGGSTWESFASLTSWNAIVKDVTFKLYLNLIGDKAFVLCRGISKINKIIETTTLTYTQTSIKGEIPYYSDLNITKNIPFDAQLLIRGSNTTATLKLSAQYTGNVAAVGSIQASDIFNNGRDTPIMLNLNPLGGNIGINCNFPQKQLDINGDVQIRKDVASVYNLSSVTTLDSQLIIGHTSGTGRTYLGNHYTSGNTYGVLQASDYYAGTDHRSRMYINPLGGTIVLGASETSNNPAFYTIGTTNWSTTMNYQTEGILVSIPSGYLNNQINGIYFNSGTIFYNGGTYGITSGSGYRRDIGLYVNRHIWSESGFVASSDQRIKTNIRPANNEEALNDLRAIQPVLYNYKDPFERGTDEVYGFIAQQVSSVFDYGVSFQKSVVPDYFSTCAVKIQSENSTTYVTFKDITSTFLHSLSTSQCVKFIDGSYTPYVIHVSSISDTEFTAITPYEIKDLSGSVFLYGSEVDDFQVLDKNALFTLNFAATKDIDAIQQTHASRISVLEAQVSTLQAQVSDLLASRAAAPPA